MAARLDVQRPGAEPCKPAADHLGSHLRTVVGTDMFGNTSGEHYVRHRLDDAEAVNPTSHTDREALPGELIDQRHEAQSATVMGLRLDEVVAPNMVTMLRPAGCRIPRSARADRAAFVFLVLSAPRDARSAERDHSQPANPPGSAAR